MLTRTDERDRERRIQANKLLLQELGFTSSKPPITPSSSLPSISQAQTPTIRRKKIKAPLYDRAGYILSLPGPGERHRMACVEMPSDRSVGRRITDGEYQDCTHWRYGEERRWKFGHGDGGVLAEDAPVTEGGVGVDFRWREWKGLEKELRKEMRKRGELNKRDTNMEDEIPQQEGVSEYSVS